MERIEPSERSKSFRARKRKNAPESERSERTTFTDALANVGPASSMDTANEVSPSTDALDGEKTIEELLDDIYGIGEKLKKNQDHRSVISYKKAVQHLVRIAVDRGMQVEEQTSSPNILRQKRFTLVRVIDQKLERLVSEVLLSQRDTMEILGKIDEINGLLIDLTS